MIELNKQADATFAGRIGCPALDLVNLEFTKVAGLTYEEASVLFRMSTSDDGSGDGKVTEEEKKLGYAVQRKFNLQILP